MTAIVTGQGLGLLNTSAGLLKGPGELGNAAQGTSGDKVVVDAANGNLVVQARDEWLVGLGPDVSVLRTYNSLSGAYDNTNVNLTTNVHKNWRLGFSRTVQLASGTVNSASSTVVRIAEDGSQTTYTYNSTLGKYVGHDGAGANDTLAYSTNQWTWTDGATNQQEFYDGTKGGRLTQVLDPNGHKLLLDYTTGGLINKITSDNGETVTIEYTGNNIKDVLTTYTDAINATTKTVTRVSYGYDGASDDRLHTVTVYLGNLASTATGVQQYTGSGSTYTTTYNYMSTTSTQLESIVQSDNSELHFTYEGSRVKTIKDTKSGAVTTFDYANIGTGTTTVEDAKGNVTTLTFNTTTKQLLSVSEPAVNSITPKTTYAYDDNGNITTITDARGGISNYRYDANNNLIYEQDASGHVITRTYTDGTSGTKPNLLQTLTVYTATAAANQIPVSGAQTTRYVYDTAGNLKFDVSAEGRVTNYVYSAVAGQAGLLTSKISYRRDAYPVGSLAATQAATGNGVPQPAKLSLTDMNNWLATTASNPVDQAQAERTDYAYNARGQLKTSTTYQNLKTDGTGDTTAQVAQTQYVYDQAGNLLRTIDGAGHKTTIAYDGFNRVVWSTDGAANTTQTTYNAAANTITTLAANGLSTVQTFDKSGHLLTIARSGTTNFGTVSNVFDALGNLVKTTDAASQSTCYIYDAEGNQVGMVSPNRELTEYIYNKAGQLIHTIAYAKQIPTAALSVAPASLTLAGIKGTPGFAIDTANDRHTYKLYDQAGRLAKTIDSLGYVVAYRYDGRGELLQTKQYNTALNGTQLSALQAAMAANAEVSPGDANATASSSSNSDRTQYNIYSPDGLLLGSIDGTKNVSVNTYNSAGELIQTTRYANAYKGSTLSDNVLPTPYDAEPSPTPTTAYLLRDRDNDQNTFYYYNASGQRTAVVDAEGYLTEYSYNKVGKLASEKHYINRYKGTAITSALDANTRPAVVSSDAAAKAGTSYVVADPQDATKTYSYDGDNRLVGTINPLDSNWTIYRYNKTGQLERTISDYVNAETARSVMTRYDQLGRVIAQMGTDGANALDALGGSATPSQIDQVWNTYGTRYTYDNAGHKTSSIDPSGNTTLYFYDADGRITQAVNALGEVTEYSYDAFGDTLTQKQYGTRIVAATLTAMKAQGGGFNTASFRVGSSTLSLSSILQSLSRTSNDSLTTKTFDQRGQVTAITQAITSLQSSSTTMSYNAFGELYKDDMSLGGDEAVENTHFYDNAGRQTSVWQVLSQGSRFSQVKQYDAFGRVKATAESQNTGKKTTYTYDRLGRQLSITDTLGAISTNTYDAFGRVLTTRDALNNLTTYTYDDASRSITVVHGANTAAAFTTTSYTDAFGHTIMVTDGRGNNTIYGYNADGVLISTQVQDAAGTVLNSSSSTLDHAQRVTTTTDANGVVTTYSYDATSRVTSKVIDPTPTPADGKTHLNLTTTYSYDAKGQAIWVRDANNVWTHTEYDLKGEVVTITVDPSDIPSSTDEATFTLTTNANPLNLQTTYAYDSVGNKVLVTEGAGSVLPRVTKYSYDQWGRRTQEVVDPTPTVADGKTHLNLTTDYTYDKSDNLVSKTVVRDASTTPVTQDVTRYVYDTEDQLVYTVDAAGGVTYNEYDANGRVTRTTAYANTVTIDTTKLALAATDITGVLVKNASVDHINISVYNSVGQLTFSVDALNNVTEHRYDASGNVTQVTKYVNPLSAAPTAITSGSFVRFADPAVVVDSTKDQTTQYVYDSANRAIWTLQYDYDSQAKVSKIYVSQNQYDKNGNVTQTRRYATALTGSYALGSTPAVTKDDAKDQITNTVYDAANRATFVIVAADASTNYVIQNAYDKLGHLKSSTRFAKPLQGSYVSGVAPTVVGPTGSATGSYVQQSASTDTSKDATTQYNYDNAGRLWLTTDAEGNLNTRKYDGASRLTDVTLSAADGSNASTTHYVYDAAGRVTDEIKGYTSDSGATARSDYADTRYVLDGVGNRVKIIDPRGVDLAESDSNWAQSTRVSLGYAQKVANLAANDATALKARYTSTQTFDALGHVTLSTNTLGKFTYTKYDAFGNAIQITDPNGNSGYFFFDQLNQATWQVDPMGYATQTVYNGLGQVRMIIKYANAVRNGDKLINGKAPLSPDQVTDYKNSHGGALPDSTIAYIDASTLDATSTIEHDKIGHQTQIKDALGFSESMSYDAFGNKVSYTTKSATTSVTDSGGIYSYEYDRKGNLVKETLPVKVYQYNADGGRKVPDQSAVYNVYAYDARGNRTQSKEAVGLQEQKITNYTYDSLDRLLTQSGEAMATTFTVEGGVKSSATPLQTVIKYDAAGNVIDSRVVGGEHTMKWFDALNRVTTQWVATESSTTPTTGTLSTFVYDAAGNLMALKVYAQLLAEPSAGVAPVAPTVSKDTDVRETRYTYDANGRQTSTVVPDVLVGQVNAQTGNYEVRRQDIVTRKLFDANGKVTCEVDARGNTTWHVYDKLGNERYRIDGERYVVAMEYDAAGRVVKEVHYAKALTTPVTINSVLTVDGMTATVAALASADDRQTNYVRDKLGQVKEQRVANVLAGSITSTGALTDATKRTVVIKLDYNGLGQVVQKTEDTSEVLTWKYDVLGRVTETRGASFADNLTTSATPTSVQHVVNTEYTGNGNVARKLERGDMSTSELDDRITFSQYGLNGLLLSQRDATGSVLRYWYDAAGHVTATARTRSDAAGLTTASTDVTTYQYDPQGRQIKQSIYNLTGSDAFFTGALNGYTALQTQDVRYDAFGQIASKGSNGGWQEVTEYDKAGRAIKTNSETGATKAYVYDANGNATLEIESTGIDLSGMSVQDMLARQDLYQTVSVYDGRNQLTDTYEPQHGAQQLGATATPAWQSLQVISNTTAIAATDTSLALPVNAKDKDLPSQGEGQINFLQIRKNPSTARAFPERTLPSYALFSQKIEISVPGWLRSDSSITYGVEFVPDNHVNVELIYQDGGDSGMFESTPKASVKKTAVGDLQLNIECSILAPNSTRSCTARVYALQGANRIYFSGTFTAQFSGQNAPGGVAIQVQTPDQAPFVNLRQQPAGTNRIMMWCRPQNSPNSSWLLLPQNAISVGTMAERNFCFMPTEAGLVANVDYDVRYLALNANGDILNSEEATMALSGATPSFTQTPRHIGGAGQAFVDTMGNVHLLEQGRNAISARLVLTASNGSTALTIPKLSPALIGGVLTPGWFQIDGAQLATVPESTTPYTYTLECYGADGVTVVNKIQGTLIRSAGGKVGSLAQPTQLAGPDKDLKSLGAAIVQQSGISISASSANTAINYPNDVLVTRNISVDIPNWIPTDGSVTYTLETTAGFTPQVREIVPDGTYEDVLIPTNESSIKKLKPKSGKVAYRFTGSIRNDSTFTGTFRIFATLQNGTRIALTSPMNVTIKGSSPSGPQITIDVQPQQKMTTLELSQQPSGTTRVLAWVRAKSLSPSGAWTMLSQPYALTDSQTGLPRFFYSIDQAGLDAGVDYDVRYLALNANGDILNSEDATMALSGATPSFTQKPRHIGGAGQAFIDQEGYLNLAEQGGNAYSAVLRLQSTDGSGTSGTLPLQLTPAVIGGAAVPGWFRVKLSTLNLANGPYDFLYEVLGADGKTAINLVRTKVTVANSTTFTMTDLTQVTSATRNVLLRNLPLQTQWARVTYKQKNSNTPAATAMLEKLGDGLFQWNTLNLQGASSADFEISYETFDASGRLIGSGQGSVSFGSSTPVNSALLDNQSAANWVFNASKISSQAKSLTVYYRAVGSNLPYTASPSLSANAATGNYVFNAAALLPTSANDVSYEYYCVLRDTGGQPITLTTPPSGVVRIAGLQSGTNQLQYLIVGVHDLTRKNVAHRSQTYDAFGEIVTSTDTLNHTTSYAYNAQGQLVTKTDAATTVVDSHGVSTTINPVTRYVYDTQGRLIGMQDANRVAAGDGVWSMKQTWTAEDVDGKSQVAAEYHPDGGTKINRYDRFNDLRDVLNENWNGQDSTKLSYANSYEYDKNHRVTKALRPLRDGLSARGYDRYVYDTMGNRVAHYGTASIGTSGQAVELTADRYDYDAAGRVVVMTTAGGKTTQIKYEDGVDVQGVGGKTVKGTRRTTTNANDANNQLVDETDAFGHTTFHKDLGGHAYNYNYDAAGRLASQFSSAYQAITYDYFNDGRLKRINDLSLNTYSAYEYDSEGNKTYESYATKYDFNVYQRASIAYDELNRIKTISDPQYSLQYEYDAVGNKRHIVGKVTNGSVATEDYWYSYDSMNRFLVTMGTLDGSKNIVQGGSGAGVKVTYDAQGNRSSATYAVDGHSEGYIYTKDNYLSKTTLSFTTLPTYTGAERINDLMGRVTDYNEFATDGITKTSAHHYDYDNDSKTNWDEIKVFAKDSSLSSTTKTTNHMMKDGTLEWSHTVTDFTAAGSTQQLNDIYYGYEWWDGAQQATITNQPYNENAPGWKAGKSRLLYDVNGHITQAIDSGADGISYNQDDRTLTYVNDGQGLVLFRNEKAPDEAEKKQAYFYVNGSRVGELGSTSSSIDYAQALALANNNAPEPADRINGERLMARVARRAHPRAAAAPVRPVKSGKSSNFDQNYQAINSSYPGFTSNGYRVRSNNEKLADIARAVWGDATLWYLIAEANGLMSADAALTEGQTLVIPNRVTNIHNNSGTSKVYDPGEALGNVSPTLPPAPPPPPADDDGCGVGQVLMVVVAIAVAAWLGPIAAQALGSAMLGGAVAGAAASVASQAVGLATGTIQSFSWSGVAMGAVSGAVGGAINGVGTGTAHIDGVFEQSLNTLGGGANTFATALLKATVTNVATQGLGMAVGLQKEFSWTSVAAAGVSGAIGYGLAQNAQFNALGGNNPYGAVLRGTLTGTATGWASAMVRHEKPNWGAISADAFGSALGDSIVGSIQQADSNKAPTKSEINGFLSGLDTVPGMAQSETNYFLSDLDGIPNMAQSETAHFLEGLDGIPNMAQSETAYFLAGLDGIPTMAQSETAYFLDGADDVSSSAGRATSSTRRAPQRTTSKQQVGTQQTSGQQDGGFDFARALGLPPLEKPSLLSPGFVAGILSGGRPTPSAGGSPGAYIGPWDGKTYMSRADQLAFNVDSIRNAGPVGLISGATAYVASGGNINAAASVANDAQAIDGVLTSVSNVGGRRTAGTTPPAQGERVERVIPTPTSEVAGPYSSVAYGVRERPNSPAQINTNGSIDSARATLRSNGFSETPFNAQNGGTGYQMTKDGQTYKLYPKSTSTEQPTAKLHLDNNPRRAVTAIRFNGGSQ